MKVRRTNLGVLGEIKLFMDWFDELSIGLSEAVICVCGSMAALVVCGDSCVPK